jgi:predicted TIM-barrel fold metal-dependent hydrolase
VVYATGRTFYDADSHLMEHLNFYDEYLDPSIRDRAPRILVGGRFPLEYYYEALEAREAPDFHDHEVDEVLTRKLWSALGAWDPEGRSRALDELGFSAQLVFDSFMRNVLRDAERMDDRELLVGLARTHHRAMRAFCAGDPRFLGVSYVPTNDIDDAISFAREALDGGANALEITADCPPHHSVTHVGFEPLWAMAAEARVPVVFHLGSSRISTPTFHDNGRPVEKFFAGGDVPKLGSVEYISSPMPVQETLTAMVVDGVLHRHPDLRIGLIELGGVWMPGYLQFLDSAQIAFGKTERRLAELDLKLSEYVKRQVRVSPFCHENVGWLVSQVGAEMAMFASDYPHIEGGRNPIARFEASFDAAGVGESARQRFYSTNFVDLMGGRVPAGRS